MRFHGLQRMPDPLHLPYRSQDRHGERGRTYATRQHPPVPNSTYSVAIPFLQGWDINWVELGVSGNKAQNQFYDPHDKGRLHDCPLDPQIDCQRGVTRDIDKALDKELAFSECKEIGAQFAVQAIYRSREMCLDFFYTDGPGMAAAGVKPKDGKAAGRSSYCECTMMRHFLGRWCHVRCFVLENQRNEEHWHKALYRVCACGVCIGSLRNRKVVCSWCSGEILFR
ncbi:hypothetical protein K458DRAFT_74071 [Lentithecium fluviatile CBS 122367]|uniref:Uncharacterized protein n=1 Tax=Lentithecium fluviatile CBS 122367 TaxID=1168545 RepID=A0A6G1IWM5_9PLEO|nr:hypothetical protein K458DRAFT_74071 [Lentithecium fluviatile CBS 122367]